MENTNSTRTRKTILSIVAAGITAAAITVPVLTASATAPATPAPAVETRIPEPTPTAEEQELIDWALGLYEDAGLELPELEIGIYDTKDACEGNKGTYRPQPAGPAKVRVCDWHEKATLRDAWRRKTLVHELAHAWAHENLDDEHEHELVEHRGLDNWNDRDAAWETRGTEHAAEIITWGIIDQRMRVDSRIDGTSVEELTEAYELLTGMAPTNGPVVNG